MRVHPSLGLALAVLGLSSPGLADGRHPGSLLLYPRFENRIGEVTVATVTNVEPADVTVEFKYIAVRTHSGAPANCEEFNRDENLTGLDTLTLVVNAHNPNAEAGYFYVFAKDENGPVVHNGLVGHLLDISGIEEFDYSINAVAFDGLADGDLNSNGLRDLDNHEYEAAPGEILIPRFLGQGHYRTDLILIDLAGGAQFDTTVDFLIYNDNEEVFSAEYTFHCWDFVELLDISGIFANDFLAQFTNQDPAELLGAPQLETGWIRLWGAHANSPTTTIADPAVYAVLVPFALAPDAAARPSNGDQPSATFAGDLPWERGENLTGKLLARSNDGSF